MHKGWELPSAQANSAAARPTVSKPCNRGQRAREDKDILTNEESSGLVLVVKLERTDTTLDLSQKARVVFTTLTPSWPVLPSSNTLIEKLKDRQINGETQGVIPTANRNPDAFLGR